MGFAEIENFLWAGIGFFTFLCVCFGLLDGRYGRSKTWAAGGGLLAGIVLLQTGLLLSGRSETLALTLLPLTAYLPGIAAVHILSRSGFFQTTAVWTLGLLASGTLSLVRKILIRYLGTAETAAWQRSLAITACLLAAAVLLAFVVLRYIRKPFQTYVLQSRANWVQLCFPVVMVFLLFSYFMQSATNPVVLVLVFLTALSVLMVSARLLASASAERRMRETSRAVEAQLELQRREYEAISKKVEAGRAYRHDMRHHLRVLEGLAVRGERQQLLEYLDRIGGRLSETEQKTYCEHPTVNVVLSSYLSRAEKAGCTAAVQARIPQEIPFDALDLCSILANAIENASEACQRNTDAKNRGFSLAAVFEEQRLIISVENPCETPVRFDQTGFPRTRGKEGRGIGLKSIGSIAEKYHGLFRCEYEEGIFRLNVILFATPPAAPAVKKKAGSQKAAAALTVCVAFWFAAACLPATARALGAFPASGAPLRVAELKTCVFGWGDTSCRTVLPRVEPAASPDGAASDSAGPAESEPSAGVPDETGGASCAPQTSSPPSGAASPGTETVSAPVMVPEPPKPEEEHGDPAEPDVSGGVEEINRRMETYVKEMREKFLWYAARKYDGYVALDAEYAVVRDDDRLLVIRFYATVNAGGSGQYSRSFVLDKSTGAVTALSDLFLDGSDYVRVISEEVKRQMAQRENSRDYFIPGGIWSDDELFEEISPDQNFYLDDQDRLVIVFDEYEVAAGSAGMPEFVIPTEVLCGLLPPSSILKVPY